ncbi:MAG TPA: aldehyde dehydrogenase family protein [Pseudonocardiaceae bacterium]|nr:aldehyde dehydrogenase family protein [Pseudonocardiaceae bacterium]
MADARAFWVAGASVTGETAFDVRHPFDGRVVASVSMPTEAQIDEAVTAAEAVTAEAAALPAYVRADALAHVSRRLTERTDELAALITSENGKPLKWARGEVARAASTFRFAAEEARRWSGELQRLDTEASATGRLALTRRFPRGPVLAIAPFNFPLNLVAHKVAPALAVGAPVIIKPAPKTPLSALALGELLAECALPRGMWSVLPVGNDRAGALVADPRLPVVSFTGSGPVGWSIREAVPRKHVTLELGGNAAVLVCEDWSSPDDLDHAASRIATFANYQAGQSCISVQRVFAQRSVYDALAERVVAAVEAQRTGDPWHEDTDVGPLIDQDAASRVQSWIEEAVAAGAEVLTGGTREGATVAPTVLAGVPSDARVASEEIFGPVLVMEPVDDVDDAFARINSSRYGLQAGVFTHQVTTAFRAHRELQVGGVVIGDVPSYRADQMAYGGVKESGIGREGVRYAMEDYTCERVMVLAGVDL